LAIASIFASSIVLFTFWQQSLISSNLLEITPIVNPPTLIPETTSATDTSLGYPSREQKIVFIEKDGGNIIGEITKFTRAAEYPDDFLAVYNVFKAYYSELFYKPELTFSGSLWKGFGGDHVGNLFELQFSKEGNVIRLYFYWYEDNDPERYRLECLGRYEFNGLYYSAILEGFIFRGGRGGNFGELLWTNTFEVTFYVRSVNLSDLLNQLK
jgi:hypothetical protein